MGSTASKEGMIYIYFSVYLHGIDESVRVQSTHPTLKVGDSVSVFRFTGGR